MIGQYSNGDGRNADHRSTWCRGHHKGSISKRQDRKMRKCQGYQDLSGKNRRDDRAQKEAFCGRKEV